MYFVVLRDIISTVFERDVDNLSVRFELTSVTSWHRNDSLHFTCRMSCWLMCLSDVCVCEQEAASVAEAEESSLANAVSGTAPDSGPDEPKDAEAEETVSHSP